MPDLNSSAASHSAPALQSPSSGNSSDAASDPHTPPATASSTAKQEYGPHNSRDDSNQQIRFPDLETVSKLKLQSGEEVVPDIDASIERNIFFREKRWTCYRRNYLFVQCSYSLSPCIPGAPIYVETSDGKKMVQALGVKLAAVMDQDQGKDVGLVQQTPKRDRGPQLDVKVEKLAPIQKGEGPNVRTSSAASSSGPYLPLQSEDSTKTPSAPPNGTHTFERIQFKQATANNGRRRAQQQFYYLLVELHADIRKSADRPVEWVKIAHRASEPMVVRGRSPGHYKDSPTSSASQGGAGGGFGSASYGYGHAGPSLPYGLPSSGQGRSSMSGPPGGSGGYFHSHSFTSPGWASVNPSVSLRSPISTLEPKSEAGMSDQEIQEFETAPGYGWLPMQSSSSEPQLGRSSFKYDTMSSGESSSYGSSTSQWSTSGYGPSRHGLAHHFELGHGM